VAKEPEDCKRVRAWLDEYQSEACRLVKPQLARYPALKGAADWPAGQGVTRAGEIALFLCRQFGITVGDRHYPYFAHQYTFYRWLLVAGYREALRFVLDAERVQPYLHRLPDEQRVLLRYRYIDQFGDEGVARVMHWRTERRPFLDLPRARMASLAAYQALCDLLAKHYQPQAGTPGGRYTDYASLFPLFPCFCPGDSEASS
jgi:hypothetical protein